MAGYRDPGRYVGGAQYAAAAPRPEDFDPMLRAKRQATVVITEQPAPKALRFRYECEGRSAGSIPGANSSAEAKTFPSVRIAGYRGPAVVVVSCVTRDPPHWPHPHNLVGKDGCKKGVCTVNMNVDTMSVTFQNLGIQCVKKKDVEDSLRQREAIRVDPFHTGFEHRLQPTAIDLNTVRLCFQAFLEGHEPGRFEVPLKPVVSEPIFDKKSMCDLVIYKMSDCSASVAGGRDIILLCDKVTKDDVEVRFYEMRDERLHWESFGEFVPSEVHKQVAICFRTPRYVDPEVDTPVRVQIELRRPSDKQYSEPRAFTLTPVENDGVEEKRRKMARNSAHLQRFLEDNLVTAAAGVDSDRTPRPRAKPTSRSRLKQQIKPEPMEASPPDPPLYPPAAAIVSPTSMSGGGIVRQPGALPKLPPGVYGVEHMIKTEYLGSPPAGMYLPADGSAPPPPPPPPPQLLDMDTQLPTSAAAAAQPLVGIELDLRQLNSSDLNMLFPSETEVNQQTVERQLVSSSSQSLSFLEPPEAPLAPAAGATSGSEAQMDSFTRSAISDLQFLNQLSRK